GAALLWPGGVENQDLLRARREEWSACGGFCAAGRDAAHVKAEALAAEGNPEAHRAAAGDSGRNGRRSVAAGRETDAMTVMMRSMLEVADNSGARKLQMILPLGGATGLRAGLGDVITASVKEASPDGQVQKGKVVKAVIVRTRK